MILGERGAVWGAIPDPAYVIDGGWHFCDLGDSDFITRKVESFSHWELRSSRFSSREHLERCRSFGIDYRQTEDAPELA